MSNSFDAFLNPRGIAIIGASSDPTKLGHAVARNLVESKYPGAIHLVNPKGGRLFSRTMFKSIQDVPDPVELAVIIVPANSAVQALRDAGERGIRAAILTSGGFRETGPAGADIEKQVIKTCAEFDIRLIGPNCVGLLDTGVPFDTTFLPQPMPAAGNIAFLSHSGAFCAAMIDWAREQGFGFSQIVSLGNQADLTETDLLPAFAHNPHTRTICLYLETISSGQDFLKAASSITIDKPIVVLKVGRTASGQKAAASHTGAMAGSEVALNATLDRAGVLRANTAEQLFDWARALSACPIPTGKRIAILTSAGGPGVIASDALEAEGFTLAQITEPTENTIRQLLPSAASTHNPIDMLASASPDQYSACLGHLLDDPAVDGVMVITLPSPNYAPTDIAAALIPIIQTSAKPVIVAQMGAHLVADANQLFQKAGIPVFPFPERAASALGALLRRAAFLTTCQQVFQPPAGLEKPDAAMDASELVAQYGITTAPLVSAPTPEAAAYHAGRMKFPLVAKIASPDILHKSDIGGVLLNLDSVEKVVYGFETIMKRARAARPDARLEGITLQLQISEGQDVIIGAVRDPQFGPLMMFGSGGVEAEGLKDVAFAMAPLNKAEAKKMLERTWAGKKLDGFRNIAPVDKNAVIDALVRLSWLIIQHPEIAEIEINPLRVLNIGAVAVDIREKLIETRQNDDKI